MAGPQARIPSELRAQPTLTRLAELTRTTKTRKSDVDHTLTAIERHLAIARDHDAIPDGYPTHTSGAGPATTTGIPDPDRVELTSVEAAYEARLRWKDEHDTRTAIAWGHVQVATFALAAASQLLRKLDGEATPPAAGLGLEDETWCANHLRHGIIREPRGSDGGVHCRWCADFNRTYGELPAAGVLDYRRTYGKITETTIRSLQPSAFKAAV